MASIVVAAVVWFIFFSQDILTDRPGDADDFLVLGMMPVAIMVAASAVTLVAVSLVTRPPAPEIVDRFFMSRSSAS
jgi:hypothetical protein